VLSPPARRIAGFGLRFLLVYGVLVAAWPLLARFYRPAYCALGNVLFGGGEASARFRPLAGAKDLDVEVRLTKRGPPLVSAVMKNDSRLVGYMPLISLVALVLASPIPWKRRRTALGLGLVLVTAFVAVRMSIPIRRDFSRPDALQVHQPGAFGRWLLDVSERALLDAPASFFVVPVLIWVLVALRREDLELGAPREDREAV
jgi:hypothetical protein